MLVASTSVALAQGFRVYRSDGTVYQFIWATDSIVFFEGEGDPDWVEPIPQAVQSTVRIGRILPVPWDAPDYARFMVLNTVLGGYFGSRLMSNIREDKGYTYGIYSITQLYRGSIVFYITADVAAEVTQAAVDEVMSEIGRLQQFPIGEEELERVRNYMMGDFIRSIDGVFDLSERYRQMMATHVDEHLTTNILHAIAHVTPAQLQTLAQSSLTDLDTVVVGN